MAKEPDAGIETKTEEDPFAEYRPKGLCRDCEKHKASVCFSSGGMMELSHGMYMFLCQCCYVKRIKKMLNETSKNLERQQKKLKKKGCE